MGNKKWVALLVILMLAMGMLTGCSTTEKEYYNLLTETSNLKVFQESGSIELNITQLPDSIFTGENAISKELIIKAFNQHRLDYEAKVDLNQSMLQYDTTIVNVATGEKTPFISIVYKNDMFYLKIDDMVKYLANYCNAEEKQKLDRLFGNIEYVSINPEDLYATMPLDMQTESNPNYLQKSIQQQLIIRRLIDGLLDNVYDKYQSNMITKDNNKYTFTLRGADSINVLKPAAIYTLNNIDKLGPVLKAFLNGLSQDESITLGLNNKTKGEVLEGIDQIVLDVDLNREEYLNNIEDFCTTANASIAETVNDSELVSSIEKTDTETYDTMGRMRVHITAGTPVEDFNLTLSVKDKIKGCTSIQIAAPTGKVTAYKELEKRMPKQMNVYIDGDIYFLSQGFSSSSGLINVRLKNDQAYLPLRKVAEAMGDKVGWDASLQQAYVERNGQHIIMNGIIANGKILVKSRDFESLGYKIGWDEATRSVTIEK